MLKLYLPSVPPMVGDNVIVPNETWQRLVEYVDTMHTVINTQADKIVSLTNAVSNANENIKILADAVGGLYHET
ncbi:MAG: hypothetical protein J6R62_00105 [Rikenellaceae bacterium]|nr:hypothetical protein [Rikenellaceae bacterium]